MISGALDAHLGAGFRSSDNLARNLYCVLGLPIDALEMPSVLQRIDAAAASRVAFLISTPNLDFPSPEPVGSAIQGDIAKQRSLSG